MDLFHRVLEICTYLFLAVLVAAGITIYVVQGHYYQKVRTDISHDYGVKLTQLLSEFHAQKSHFPSDLDAVNPPKPEEFFVGSVSYQKLTGIVSIQVAGDTDDEGVLLFDPVLDGGLYAYTCHAIHVPDKYRPKNCLSN